VYLNADVFKLKVVLHPLLKDVVKKKRETDLINFQLPPKRGFLGDLEYALRRATYIQTV
jgi:hypothetical protein